MLSKRASIPLLYYYCASSFLPRSSPFALDTPTQRARGKQIISSAMRLSSTTSSSSVSPNDIVGRPLVSILDAIALHSDRAVKFVDGSWFLGGDRNGRQEFEAGPRIAEARFFDIDDIATSTPNNLPHMMPSPQLFAAWADINKIQNQEDDGDNDHIIVYGSANCMFTPRTYITFKSMGHPKSHCHLLDGSLQDWIDAGGPIEEAGLTPTFPVITAKELKSKTTETRYQARTPQNVVTLQQLKSWIEAGKTVQSPSSDSDGNIIIVDARPEQRFRGEVEEPRPGLRVGHMPGAKNLPFVELLDPDNKHRFLTDKDEIRKVLVKAGIPIPLPSKNSGTASSTIVSTCGSGVTACHLLVALDILGENLNDDQALLYDGSWAEWGSKPDTPIVKEAQK